MTPKEEAIKLVEDYRLLFLSFGDYVSIGKCQQCALIAVDKIIEATNMYQYSINNLDQSIPSKIVNHPHWQQVKKELEQI